MTRLIPEQRYQISKAIKKGVDKSVLVAVYCVSLVTICFWGKQDLRTNFSDLPRNHKSKIAVEVEIMILYLRITFSWGTARIQQGLLNLPDFMLREMETVVQNFYLSRTSINNILKKHKLNGYRRKTKSWKFFRAKFPNELWQLDLKGPFRVEGRKYWVLVVIDDFSRYILQLKLFDHMPNINEITNSISFLVKEHKPQKILTDNNPFGHRWEQWCKTVGTEAIFAHPYYPQDKGKVERTIRNLTEEFINLLAKFPQWLHGKLEEWRVWFNTKRFHRGIKDFPANLFC